MKLGQCPALRFLQTLLEALHQELSKPTAEGAEGCQKRRFWLSERDAKRLGPNWVCGLVFGNRGAGEHAGTH